MKKRDKQGLSLALSLVLAVSLLVLPASATTTTFQDVTHGDTAMAIESLRLMEVLGGYSDGTFRPNESLTRGQFCKMVVYAQDGASQLGLYSTYTIFPDVRPSHWASGYINMASRGLGAINGFADGKFYPDSTITGGQAVTILMRLLGYSDGDVGAVWPDGYLAQAASIGLTDGVDITANGNLSRGQAAELFANLLLCHTKDGGSYASAVASSVLENVVLLSSNAQMADGTTGAMELGNGSTYKMANTTSTGLLNGCEGTLLLNKEGKVMTFVPNQETTSKTITVGESAPLYLKDNAGVNYTLSADTQVYRNGSVESWSDVYSWVNPGSAITLHMATSGNVSHIFVGSGTSAESAIVVTTDGSSAGLEALAGSSSYAMYKNGLPASRGDLKAYDVATYDGATNAIRISDLRLTGYYEACYPSVSAPSTITVLGKTFDVLPSAVEALGELEMYQSITLLLTEDLQVAGAVKASGSAVRGNAVGIATQVSTTSATVELFNGMELSGDVSYSDSRTSELLGQLVRVSSSSVGKISLTKVSGSASDDLNLGTETLGTVALADNVLVYETVSGGVLRPVSLADIPGTSVKAQDISYVGKDWRGDVNVLILDDVTGNNYAYGRANVTKETVSGNFNTVNTYTLAVTNGNETTSAYQTTGNYTSGTYLGIAPTIDGQKIASVATLTALEDVANSAWLDSSTVVVNGTTYTVADDATAYNKDSRSWITLATARGYASESTLYVDSHNVVRIVEIG